MPWFGWLALVIFLCVTYFPAGALAKRAFESFDPSAAMAGSPHGDPGFFFWMGYFGLYYYLSLCAVAAAWKTLVYFAKGVKTYWRFVQRLRG